MEGGVRGGYRGAHDWGAVRQVFGREGRKCAAFCLWQYSLPTGCATTQGHHGGQCPLHPAGDHHNVNLIVDATMHSPYLARTPCRHAWAQCAPMNRFPFHFFCVRACRASTIAPPPLTPH
jgi:hypothetical protein